MVEIRVMADLDRLLGVTGYAGRPWELAEKLAQQSMCVRTGVGAVLTDVGGGRLIGYGWNPGKFCAELCPRGRFSHLELPREASFVEHPCLSAHAEVQAILDAKPAGLAELKENGGEMYIATLPRAGGDPCPTCVNLMDALRIKTLKVG